ncbi:MAG: hypothetical protein AAF573_05835 [Bacteroidota bacterium]
MKNITKHLLFIIFGIGVYACHAPAISQREQILTSAVDFLWEKQAADGGWHSETHGILKSGQSVSAFVFYNLLQVPKDIYQPTEEQITSALNFLRKNIKDGVLGNFDPLILDYPNYATAYALRIFWHFDLAEDQPLLDHMTQYLVQQQFTEQRGFSKNHPAYGAWGFGEKFLAESVHGHVDLSHTRRILETLQLLENQPDSIFKNSQIFLSLLQKDTTDTRSHPSGVSSDQVKFDGGFYASTVTVATNKGNLTAGENPLYRSYATATADGLLALLAAGVSQSDARVQAAFRWLLDHPRWEYPEGIPHDDFNQWHRVMFYYHLAVRSQAYRAMKHTKDWKNEIVNVLLGKQSADGSFSNPMGAANKEDDPLLATCFVLQALL